MVSSLYGVSEEAPEIWVYLEQQGGDLEGVSLELFAKGRQMADQIGWHLVGLLLGDGVTSLAEKVFAFGADRVWSLVHPLLDRFTIEAYAHATFQAIMKGKPSVFLLGATPDGRDLAARLAVRLRTGLNADCTDLRLDTQGGLLVSEVSGFGGGVLALIQMDHHRPQMATVRPGVFSKEEAPVAGKGEVIHFPVELHPDMIHTRIVDRVVGKGVDLTQAKVLVAGGRGISGDFDLLERLADLLDGQVGATRPPVDDGYIERERQIGQTGVICSPKLAICCGISGAFHFVVGVDKSDTVIAINSDQEAPIFEFSDYGVVGDLQQVLPELIAELSAMREAPRV
jgi:electron transfer flavoprotein alpha subunit